MSWKSLNLQSWGKLTAPVSAARPDRVKDAISAMRSEHSQGLIGFGMGRSYGDTALNSNGQTLLSERLNRLIDFNPDSGELVAEAGVTIQELLQIFLPRGFLLPVAPGTAFVTLGGAIANDVHGKNHDIVGSFGQHLNWIELLLPSGEIIKVSPEQRSEVFAATIGGIGLTGIILSLSLNLIPVSSAVVKRRETRIANLDDYIKAFDELSKEGMVYSVGWIDGTAKGAKLGRGILEISTPKDGPRETPTRRNRSVPLEFPGFALNKLSIKAFNGLYARRVPKHGREMIVPYETMMFPLDSIHHWNRIYGKRGFYQFQCALPTADGLPKLMETISAAGSASFLAVLKTLGGEGLGHLSFPIKGYTLALDFPRRPGIETLMKTLEDITLEYGGRIYLAKDACLSAAGFAQMYPQLDAFREILNTVDPEMRMASDMARRLNIREYPQ